MTDLSPRPRLYAAFPGLLWAHVRALVLIAWEFFTTGKVEGWE